GLSAGDYAVTANDNGCTSTVTSLTVNSQPTTPVAPTATVSTQPSCSLSTGTVTLSSPVGGSITYTITGTSPVVGSVTNSTGIFSGLSAGDYAVTANDNGCTSTVTSLTVNSQPTTPVAPTATVSTQPSCNQTTGVITINSPLGTQFEYSIDGMSYKSDNVFAGLAPNLFAKITVRLKASPTCISTTIDIQVGVIPQSPTINTKIINVKCSDDNTGSIEVIAQGGQGNYKYIWTGSNSMGLVTNNVSLSKQSNLFANVDKLGPINGFNTISVKVVDDNGCESNVINNITIAQPLPLTVSTIQTDNDCYGELKGAISTTITDGTAPYSITWKKGGTFLSNQSNLTGLSIGTYTFSVVDNNGCSLPDKNITILGPASPITFSTIETQPNCNTSTGQIEVTNEQPSGIYTYSIDNGAFGVSNTFVNLVSDNEYEIRIKDSKNCISNVVISPIDTAKVVPDVNGLNFSKQDFSCLNANASIIYKAGKTGYIYSLDNFITSNTSGIFENLIPNVNYQVYVKSKDNCIAVTSTAFNFNPIVYSATPILADVKTKYCYGATSD
ncbi:MAG: hypothetical protein KA264_04790, partial [Crocinitomicaceae bacterium]|nr:hypothetical protein [Crocinitomicaceae bacterium]